MSKNRVRHFRKNVLNKTQAEMGEYFDISQQAYAQKENGARDFKMNEMEKFKILVMREGVYVSIDEIFFTVD